METSSGRTHLWLFLFLQIALSLTVSVSGAGIGGECTSNDNCTDVANAECNGTNCVCPDSTFFDDTNTNCSMMTTLPASAEPSVNATGDPGVTTPQSTHTSPSESSALASSTETSPSANVSIPTTETAASTTEIPTASQTTPTPASTALPTTPTTTTTPLAPGTKCNGSDTKPFLPCITRAVCNASNVCECESGTYHDTTNTCKTQIAPGASCDPASTTDQCVANAVCSGTIPTATCQCDSTSYSNTTHCLQRIAAGADCTPSATNPCVANAACPGSAGDPTAQCACGADYYQIGGQCSTRIAAGADCTPSTTNPCVANAACPGSDGDPTAQCACGADYYQNGGACSLRIAAGADCTPSTTNPCVANAACPGSAGDPTAQCACGADYYQIGGQCSTRIAAGADCTPSTTNPCVANAACPGSDGDPTAQCACGADYYQNGGACSLRIAAGADCTPSTTNPCVANAACPGSDGDPTAQCACGADYYQNGGACSLRIAAGADCTPSTTNPCVANAACPGSAGDPTAQCACGADYYQIGGQCSTRIAAGADCTPSTTNPCVANAACPGSAGDPTAQCACGADYYQNGGACSLRIAAGADCTPSTTNPCVANAACPGSAGDPIAQCACGADYYQIGGACSLKKVYGSQCNDNAECQTSNSQTCEMATGGGKLCLCGSGVFKVSSSDVCKQESDLAVQNIAMNGDLQEMTISVTWVAPSALEAAADYRAVLTSPIMESPWSTNFFFNFNPLTQGTTYNVKISTRTLRNNAMYSTENVTFDTNGGDFFTKPAQPGNLTVSEFPGPDVTLQFTSSAGHVDRYKASIAGFPDITIDAPAASGPQSVSFPGLTPGEYYNVTLVAIINPNSQPIVSEENTQQFRVQANISGVVSAFTVDNVESRTMTASWRKPTYPNGAMTGYNLLAITATDQTCVSAVVFRCTDCQTNMTEKQNTEITGCGKIETMDTTTYDLNNVDHPFQANLTGLLPDVPYTVSVSPYNEEGRGLVTSMDKTTLEEVAMPLESLNVVTGSLTGELAVSWTPGLRTGPTHYYVTWAEEDTIGSESYTMINSTTVQGYSNTSHTISGLLSYWNYKVTVHAVATLGSGPASYNTSRTMSSAPGMPIVSIDQPLDDATKLNLMISCPAERERNGVIAKFFYSSVISTEVAGPGESAPVTDCSAITQTVDVTAEKNYTITVHAVNSAKQEGERISQTKYIQPRAPKLDNVPGSVPLVMTPAPADIKQTSVEVDVCRCVVQPDQGAIVKAGITVCVKTAGEDCTSAGLDTGGTEPWTTLDTWKQFKEHGYKGKYRPTPENWNYEIENAAAPPATRRRRAVPNYDDRVAYTIGRDTNCAGQDSSVYCNGPLPDSTAIVIFVWSCTSAGCSQTASVTVATSTPPDETPVAAIVGGVIAAVLVIAVIAAILVFVMYRRRRRENNNGGPQHNKLIEGGSPMHPPVRRPIKLKDFASHLDRLHKDSNLLFQEEFEDVQEKSPKHYAQEAAIMDVNKVKNRYVNILPFDHTRVKLTADDDGDSSDFINANYIPGYTSPREYIATQGPMTSTVGDLWRMMWEQNSFLIVMLSDLQEKGKPKVDQYWPGDQHSPVQYGDIVVELTSDSTLNKYTIRTFTIFLENAPEDTRHVQQFFIPGWEDYSANLKPDDMLDFIATVRQAARSGHGSGNAASHGPICVHCSAGVGRTGTFIALDFLMQFVKEHSLEDEVDIYNLVLNMRHNRPYMVQSEKQYVFIHDTLKLIIEKKVEEMQRDDDNIYQNNDPQDNVYANQAFEPEEENLYENTVTFNGLKPTTVL